MPTVKELQADLSKRGLDTKGKKAELEKRLDAAIAAESKATKAASPKVALLRFRDLLLLFRGNYFRVCEQLGSSG